MKIPTFRGIRKDELRRQSALLAETMTIDELYEEILFEIIHVVGADSSVKKSGLFDYVKDVFKIDDEKHETAFQEANNKEAPNIILNVEVVEAKELAPKDANGFSDPFCTLFLVSKPSHRYNTSVKQETLSPIWEEYFSLPVESTVEDILALEVWDFDPAETVKEKMAKISEVKGVKGLRKLMKEIAVTGVTGKHDNEMIGYVNVPLKCIPSCGHVKWYSLEKKNKNKGLVKLKLAFSSEKNNQVAFQEGRHLIRLLLLHEIENKNIDPKEWDGDFPEPANTILRQHAAQSGLRPADECLARWLEFTRFHTTQQLNFSLFEKVLEQIIQPLKNGLYSDEEVKLFWDGVKRILPSVVQYIRKLRKWSQEDKNYVQTLTSVLKVISQISPLDVPDGFDLFPKSVYDWLKLDESSKLLLIDVVRETIKQSSSEWFDQVVANNKPVETTTDAVLQQSVKVAQLVRNDLQRSIESFNKLFYMIIGIQYAVEIYQLYDEKVCQHVQPCVKEICSLIRPINVENNDIIDSIDTNNDNLTMGTSLFELYLILQKYLMLGQGIILTDIEQLGISKFHTWFQRAVAHWLDIAVYKAIVRINKAIELDDLKPVDSSVEYSSSAIDTFSIFYQIKVFWTQLSWPDIEGNYTFVTKIIDDICRCCVHYAEKMGKRVESIGESDSVYGKKFEVTNEWCLAINNIHYIRQSIKPFVDELGIENIIKQLTESRNPTAVEHCKKTMELVVLNALENVQNKIIDLLNIMSIKMCPVVKRFLLEGGEILNQGNNHMDRLIRYLDENLTTLNSQLNSDNFDKILIILWESIYKVLSELIQDSLEKKRPAAFFANMDAALQILVGFFKQSENLENNNNFKHITNVLKYNGMETDELIHSYYIERLNEQRKITDAHEGMLTVRAQFVHSTLRIEILNARNLVAHDKNGSCDPFVKIYLIPSEKFADITKPKTKSQKKNLFPLFDESFTLQLTKEQREVPKAMAHFVVKDQDFISTQFIAEAFLEFSDIPNTTLETSLSEMAQVHMKLSKPSKKVSEIMKVLDHRQGEKLARDFVKRQRGRMTNGDEWIVPQ